MKTKIFYPSGDLYHEELTKIDELLQLNWKTICVFGGDSPTVILGKEEIR